MGEKRGSLTPPGPMGTDEGQTWSAQLSLPLVQGQNLAFLPLHPAAPPEASVSRYYRLPLSGVLLVATKTLNRLLARSLLFIGTGPCVLPLDK